ncbi:MAG: phosphoserine phosphatase SerB [Candidatus Nanoarchaeia archaeon]
MKGKQVVVGLVCFDMDGTLVDGETIVLMARACGVEEEVKKITNLAMNGLLSMKLAYKKRLKLLKGISKDDLENIGENLILMPGVEETIAELKKRGFVIAIITGSFDVFAQKIARRINANYCIANKLEIKDEVFTGKYFLEVFENKDEHVQKLKIETCAHTVIAVGDGANDLPMLKEANFGVGFCAKSIVKECADAHIGEKNMLLLIDLLIEKGLI